MIKVSFKFVNLWQSAEERRQKYHLARALGCSTTWAVAMRDWRLSKIERLFGLDFPDHYNNAPVFYPYAQFKLPGFFDLVEPSRKLKSDAL